MNKVLVDFSKNAGKVKDFNCINNGPAGSVVRKVSNFPSYERAHIPYARLHDSAFSTLYGGEYSVDVHRVFPNFDADENDPESYLFGPTDAYLEKITSVGTGIYYRLGAAIEHGYKRGTYPPKDYLKWARICEHIIRHYTEGWANGFRYDIKYWEIWNEPECTNADGSRPCWQGTNQQFADFFITVFRYLKDKFPHLKIGGPAISTCWAEDFWRTFMPAIRDAGVRPDFLSYHRYGKTVEDFVATVHKANEWLEEYGYTGTETHLNEWNYVRGWQGENFLHTIDSIKGQKGAAFVAGVMCALHPESVDMLMYYEGRPSAYCGLWDTDTHRDLPTYYTYLAFDALKQLGTAVYGENGDHLYALGATDGKNGGILVSHFDQEDGSPTREGVISVRGIDLAEGESLRVRVKLLDESHRLDVIREDIFTAGSFDIPLSFKPYDVCYLELSRE